jgi:hypothetical protein
MSPLNARVIVLTPGQPVPLSQQPLVVRMVTVAAIPGNTNVVYLGGANVRARVGEQNALPVNGGARPDMWTWADVDLSHIWIDAVTALDGVTWLAWL